MGPFLQIPILLIYGTIDCAMKIVTDPLAESFTTTQRTHPPEDEASRTYRFALRPSHGSLRAIPLPLFYL